MCTVGIGVNGLFSVMLRLCFRTRAGAFSPVIDSVFDGDRVAQFLDRTYNDGDRFGKVVFRYLV